MLLDFTKMNGAGNDFVFIDNRLGKISLTPAQIALICDRHRGVGADGLVLLKPCSSGKADWAWDFYNNDGSGAEMCGNASRCFARYVQRTVGVKNGFKFESRAGVITVSIHGDRVTVGLTAPVGMRLNETLIVGGKKTVVHSVDTGVPHAVIYVEDADKAMVQPLGAEVRFHQHFAPRGTNVNFVQLLGRDAIRVRTYERGVEGETLACGTGVTASALITAELHKLTSPVYVKVQGGDTLEVAFKKKDGAFTDVQLTGPADFTFDGKVTV